MRARPVKMHYCEDCSEHHEGSIIETNGLQIGCCFNLAWEGTREDAASLYDYLKSEGYLGTIYRSPACGLINNPDDSYMENDGEPVWRCGECGAFYADSDAQQQAVRCCAPMNVEAT